MSVKRDISSERSVSPAREVELVRAVVYESHGQVDDSWHIFKFEQLCDRVLLSCSTLYKDHPHPRPHVQMLSGWWHPAP